MKAIPGCLRETATSGEKTKTQTKLKKKIRQTTDSPALCPWEQLCGVSGEGVMFSALAVGPLVG